MKDAVFLLQVQAAWQLSPLPPHPDFAVRSEPPFAFCSAMSDNTVFTLKTAWIEPRRVNAGKMAVSGVVLEINKGDGTFRLSLLWRTWSVFLHSKLLSVFLETDDRQPVPVLVGRLG